MSSIAGQEGSEDVTDFLQRIKELGDKRDQEDEERNRKLEEEILQGRKERQARRSGEFFASAAADAPRYVIPRVRASLRNPSPQCSGKSISRRSWEHRKYPNRTDLEHCRTRQIHLPN